MIRWQAAPLTKQLKYGNKKFEFFQSKKLFYHILIYNIHLKLQKLFQLLIFYNFDQNKKHYFLSKKNHFI